MNYKPYYENKPRSNDILSQFHAHIHVSQNLLYLTFLLQFLLLRGSINDHNFPSRNSRLKMDKALAVAVPVCELRRPSMSAHIISRPSAVGTFAIHFQSG